MLAPLSGTPEKRVPFKKAFVVSLLALAAASVVATGCKREEEKADDALYGVVDIAREKLVEKPDGNAAVGHLETPNNVHKDAAPEVRSLSALLAARAQLFVIDDLMRQIGTRELAMRRVLDKIDQQALVVQSNNVAIAALAAREPKETLAALNKTREAADTGDGGKWVVDEKLSLLARAAADQTIKDLTGKIAALGSHRGELLTQQHDADAKAKALENQSDQAQGKKSVELYDQAQALRKTSGGLRTQIVEIDAQIANIRRDLGIAQAQAPGLTTAVAKVSDQINSITDDWKSDQKQIDDMSAQSSALVNGESAGASGAAGSALAGDKNQPVDAVDPELSLLRDESRVTTMAGAAARLEQISKEIDDLRKQANDQIAAAQNLVEKVAALNHEVQNRSTALMRETTSGGASSVRQAYQQMIDLSNDSVADLERAHVLQRQARLNADAAIYTDDRLDVQKRVDAILATAKLTPPPGLNVPENQLAEQVKADRDAALKAYVGDPKDASSKGALPYLEDVIARTSGESQTALSQAASAAKVVTEYDYSTFARSIGDTNADKYVAIAKNLAKDLSARGVAMALPLPDEIAPPPPAPQIAASAPSTAPAPTAVPDVPGTTNITDSPDQADVRKVVAAFVQAISTGDAATAKSLATDDAQADVDAAVAPAQSMRKLVDALLAKFGDAAKPSTDAMLAMMMQMSMAKTRLPITVKEDQATVEDSTDPDPFTLKKVSGAWKVSVTPSPAHAAGLQMMQKLSAALDGVTADVTSGKLATFPDALNAMQQAFKNATGGAAGPGPSAATPDSAAPGAAPGPGNAGGAGPAPAPTTPAPTTPAPTTPAPTTPAPLTPSPTPATPPAQ